ncbi:hypothetical protein GCM10028792_14920 [Salinisphaera aquimarina]
MAGIDQMAGGKGADIAGAREYPVRQGQSGHERMAALAGAWHALHTVMFFTLARPMPEPASVATAIRLSWKARSRAMRFSAVLALSRHRG